MNVTLPNGQVINGVPEGTSKEEIAQKAISSGLAKESDFGDLFATPEVGDNIEKPEAGAVNPVTPDDPYFLPIEEGQTKAVPDATGGSKEFADFTPSESVVGALETGLSTLTGGTTGVLTGSVGGLVGMLGDLANVLTPEEAQELQKRWAAYGTYQPKTEAGQAQVRAIGELTESLPPITGAATPRVRIGKESRPRVLSDQQRRAIQFSEETGAPLMATDIDQPSTFAGRAIRGAAEKVPIAGTGKQRATQQEARQSVTGSYLEGFEQVTDQDLYNSLIKSKDKKSQAISSRYESIGNKMGDTTVSPTKTISSIDAELAELQKPGKVQVPEVINELTKLKDQLTAGDINYNDMRNNRTLIRETLKSDVSKTMSDRVIDRVYRSMTDDIQSAVESKLGIEQARKLKQVDSALYQQFNDAKKTKLKNVLNKGDVKPEEVTKMLMSNDRSDVQKLYKELDKSGRDNARSLIIAKLKDRFDNSESPDQVLQEAKKLSKQFDVFFRGSQRDDFNNLVSYLKQTKQASNAGVYNQNGQQLMTAITMAPVADIAGAGGVATAAAASVGLAGRVLESRKVRAALRRLKNVRPYTPEYNQALIALDNAVNEATNE